MGSSLIKEKAEGIKDCLVLPGIVKTPLSFAPIFLNFSYVCSFHAYSGASDTYSFDNSTPLNHHNCRWKGKIQRTIRQLYKNYIFMNFIMWKNWHCVLNHKKVKILGKIRQLNLENKKFTNFNLVITFKIKYKIQGIRF